MWSICYVVKTQKSDGRNETYKKTFNVSDARNAAELITRWPVDAALSIEGKDDLETKQFTIKDRNGLAVIFGFQCKVVKTDESVIILCATMKDLAHA